MLRLFQLQWWIHQSYSDEDCLSDAARVFAALSLSRQMKKRIRKRDQRSGQAAVLKDFETLIKEPEMARMLGIVLSGKNALYGLTEIYSLRDAARFSAVETKHQTTLSQYLDFVLQLRYGNEKSAPHALAERLHRYCTIHNAADPDTASSSLRTVRDIKRDRKERAAFLYVAKKLNVDAVVPLRAPAQTMNKLRKMAGNRDVFQEYFAHCAWVQGALPDRQIRPRALKLWAGVEAKPIPGIGSVSEDLLEKEQAAYDACAFNAE
jgi:hypothetical protein